VRSSITGEWIRLHSDRIFLLDFGYSGMARKGRGPGKGKNATVVVEEFSAVPSSSLVMKPADVVVAALECLEDGMIEDEKEIAVEEAGLKRRCGSQSGLQRLEEGE
jgi:hypothetical protein